MPAELGGIKDAGATKSKDGDSAKSAIKGGDADQVAELGLGGPGGNKKEGADGAKGDGSGAGGKDGASKSDAESSGSGKNGSKDGKDAGAAKESASGKSSGDDATKEAGEKKEQPVDTDAESNSKDEEKSGYKVVCDHYRNTAMSPYCHLAKPYTGDTRVFKKNPAVP
jgi:hypothetical protein